jgi:hypothetical protein
MRPVLRTLLAFPFLDPKRDDRSQRGSTGSVINVCPCPFYAPPAVRENPSFLTTSRRAMTATHFCGPPLVRTVMETRFAKPSAGDGFGEPIGREREHNAPFASSAG